MKIFDGLPRPLDVSSVGPNGALSWAVTKPAASRESKCLRIAVGVIDNELAKTVADDGPSSISSLATLADAWLLNFTT